MRIAVVLSQCTVFLYCDVSGLMVLLWNKICLVLSCHKKQRKLRVWNCSTYSLTRSLSCIVLVLVGVDNDWNFQAAKHQDGLPSAKQVVWAADSVAGSWTLPEVSQRLPRLQAQLLPALLLHFGRRAAEHSGKQRSALCAGTHDQGVNVMNFLVYFR